MENDNLGTPLKETLEEFKSYIENQVTYNKLVFTRKAGELSSYLMLVLLLLGLTSFVLLFLSFAFAGWFSDITNLGIGIGYLVVAGFYTILGIIVYINRIKLIFNPTRKLLGKILFGDHNDPENSYSFDSEQSQLASIKKAHEDLKNQREVLNKKISELSHLFTFSNIAHQMVDKAYSSVLTTSNIAKFAFKLVRKLKWFSERKKRKAIKKEDNTLLEDSKE